MTYLFKFNKGITEGFSCLPIADNFTTENKFGKSYFKEKAFILTLQK